jgi:lysine 6-dehydrogenase
MKILVIGGGGQIGRAVAWDLAKMCEDVDTVGVADVSSVALQRVKNLVDSDKIVMHALDVNDREAALGLIRKYDVCVSTLPDRGTSYGAIEAAVDAGVDFVDILEECHKCPDIEEDERLDRHGMGHREYGDWLHQRAVERGVTILDGMGFAPGLSNVTVGEGIRKLDMAKRVVARVGGIPSKEASKRHPLRYMITWAFAHVLREYMIGVQIIENGKPTIVPAMDGHEVFRFTEFGRDEELEAFITPGMPSIVYTRPQLEYFAEKTVRWPGHWQGIQTLKECGLLSAEPVDSFIPRQVLSKVLTPRLMPQSGDTDVCVMYNTIEGIKDGRSMCITYHLWDEGEPDGFTSMARVTGFTAAVSAVLLGNGKVKHKGIVAPEDAFEGGTYQLFIRELGKRNIKVAWRCSSG